MGWDLNKGSIPYIIIIIGLKWVKIGKTSYPPNPVCRWYSSRSLVSCLAALRYALLANVLYSRN